MMKNLNEYESYNTGDGYFGVTNLGGFSAIIYASYIHDNRWHEVNSGTFTLFLYREIKIPAGAINVHIYALASNGLGQWTPVYNNNFLTTPVVELKLYGTIWGPYASIIKDSNKTVAKVIATNNGGFITRYRLGYYFSNAPYYLDSGNFSLGMSREIAIPSNASSIFVAAEYFNGAYWDNIYNYTFETPKNIELTFTGTIETPRCNTKVTPPTSNEIVKKQATLICSKKPHKNMANLNDIITFAIHITNPTSIPTHDVMLKENLSKELEFIPNSFKVNGIVLKNIDISSPVKLEDIQMQSSLLITYKVKVISIPTTKKIINEPVISFSYIDENSVLKTSSSKGVVIALNIGKKL